MANESGNSWNEPSWWVSHRVEQWLTALAVIAVIVLLFLWSGGPR
jgi:hypothetical protein